MPDELKQPKSIPERNQLLNDLINEQGVVTPAPSPTATPAPTHSLGQLLAKLIGLG